ncbi:MAG TPA: phage protease [Polyangiaceae bacterium]|nr:phage protease [Polyangiaceae bacterium]HVZ31794.1 phage protease [Polyangiaceae bacterium]
MNANIRILSTPVATTPPTEFRLFKYGVNETAKGPVLFDATAANEVMAAYEQHGVDLMIDLEHQSLEAPVRADSFDARGWFQLELRSDGSLWAVNVRWTPDGARRLAEKTQRYISPAFYTGENGRVEELINVAICAMPATHGALPLVAASRLGTHTSRMVGTRLPNNAADAFAKLASSRGLTVGGLLRKIVLATTPNSPMPPIEAAKMIEAVAVALGMQKDSTAAEIVAVFDQLIAALGGAGATGDVPPADPTADSADGAPAPASASAIHVNSVIAEVESCLREVRALKEMVFPTRDSAVKKPAAEPPQRARVRASSQPVMTPRTPAQPLKAKVDADAQRLKKRLDDDRKLRACGMTREEFEIRRKLALRREGDNADDAAALRQLARRHELARKGGMTLEEFEARRAVAVRRVR